MTASCCSGAPTLSPAELADLGALVVASFDGVASISRPTLTVDALGGRSRSWAVVAASVPCRLVPSRSADERIEADRDTGRVSATLELPAGTDIGRADRVTVAGRVFEVLGVEARTLELVRRCPVVEVS